MRRFIALLFITGLASVRIVTADPVIGSFAVNGSLTWTNPVVSNAIYRVEWAAQPNGPWYQSFQNLNTLDGHSLTGFSVVVPMFYRVVATTNEPPVGMVWIEGGDAELGQVGLAEPVHTNFVSGFWMDVTEVTKSKWEEVRSWALTNGYAFDGPGSGKTNNHPVNTVKWYDCVKWCNARSQMEGLTPCYYIDPIYFNLYTTGDRNISNEWVNWSANGYRLPTEAEWEKAARGGRQQHAFPWAGDNTIQHGQANYFSTNSLSYDTSPTRGYQPNYNDGIAPYTSPVGSFHANGYGIHDMAGNVWEWCWDWFGNYTATYQQDPHGPASGTNRVVHGGCWDMPANYCQVAFRAGDPLNWGGDNGQGFRCARSKQ